MRATYYGRELYHYGTSGMKWGYADGQRVAGKRTAQDSLDDAVKRKDYASVQNQVNQLAKEGHSPEEIESMLHKSMGINGQTTAKPAQNATGEKKSNDDIATEVIRGNYGNGADRKKALAEAGYDYDEIQKIVNSRLKGAASAAGKSKSSKDKDSKSEKKTDTKKTSSSKKKGKARVVYNPNNKGYYYTYD